ncbi:NAD(P)H-binding protein [Serinicoccus kebangsaanensis]|uniref:NAD(P)H-binding protein n=1 Tax=Serinicoccus kebangsaanensis TaxID=2602069 RepID=UPI00124BF789|nr:NAD(P)H-binding protein [Serinicoccus kebangsaanensis]
MRRVLVTGVRAKTGAPLADVLSARGDVHVRGGTRDPSGVDLANVQAVPFGWDDHDTWGSALNGVDAVFVVRPDREDTPELISRFLRSSDPQLHVVLLSEVDGGYFGEEEWAPRVERAVHESGRTWTVLRPTWFMQVFSDSRFMLDDVVQRGVLAFPSAGQSVSWIDARDIAAVAERALTEDGHQGRTYELSGPEALSLPETARQLAGALDRPVQHVEITLDEALEGTTGFARQNDAGALERVRLGMAGTVTQDVQAVTGRRARTFAEFLHEDAAFRPASEWRRG